MWVLYTRLCTWCVTSALIKVKFTIKIKNNIFIFQVKILLESSMDRNSSTTDLNFSYIYTILYKTDRIWDSSEVMSRNWHVIKYHFNNLYFVVFSNRDASYCSMNNFARHLKWRKSLYPVPINMSGHSFQKCLPNLLIVGKLVS